MADFFRMFHQFPLTNSTPFDEVEFGISNFQNFFFFNTYSPFLIACQSIWNCIIVRRCASHLNWWKSYLLCGFLTFAGNYIALFMTYSPSPLLENPFDVPLFSIIWICVNCSSNDFFYRLITLHPITFIFQIIFCLIKVRSICLGCEIGMNSFPNSVTGAILVSIVFSSMDSLIWMFYLKSTRDFSNLAIFRNTSYAFFYYYFINKLFVNDIKTDSIKAKKSIAQFTILVSAISLTIIENIKYGMTSNKGIDITLITYLKNIIIYHGNE